MKMPKNSIPPLRLNDITVMEIDGGISCLQTIDLQHGPTVIQFPKMADIACTNDQYVFQTDSTH